ncbi:MAG: ABC transporter permease [Proteobacteria bacterium]|nr:MAG: ABC transporter permease [Pseudomonadota bacterium]
MSRTVASVFLKEIIENLRDRRVVLSAFLFGVLLGPVLFAAMMSTVSNRTARIQDQPLELPVAGSAHAPNLLAFLRENGVDVQPVELSESQAIEAVRDGTYNLVLIIDEDYGERLAAGSPAPLRLVVDTANSRTAPESARARRLLDGYGAQLAALRLMSRGMSPQIVQPLDVRNIDVATPAGRSLLLMGMITYFCLMSMLTGGFYLAIDTTAGERERGSLEPLLTLPVARSELMLGKMLATAAFMAISLFLTLAVFGVALSFVPLEALGMSANFGPQVILAMFGIMVVFVPLGAGLLTVVASFTRSTREAQTWLSLVLLVPAAPIMMAVFTGTKPTTALMAVPSLSQHLLATSLLRGDPIPPLHIAVSLLTTLAAGAVLSWIAVRLYRREAILG